MKLAIIAVVAAHGVAHANERATVGLEMGTTVSPAMGARRDTAPIGGIIVRYRIALSEQSALSFGTSIPIPPFFMAQVIAMYDWEHASGLIARGSLRPLGGYAGLCDASGQCPLDEAAEPADRGGWIVGVAAEVGGGYRFHAGSVRLEVVASYLGGVFDGRARKTESALDGYYQGGMLSFDLLF